MKKISDYIGRELLIIQKSIWKREYEFCCDEDTIARLTYPKLFSERAELLMGSETLEFYRPKIFSRQVDIRKKGYRNPFSSFKSNYWGRKGVLELPRGIRLNLKFGIISKAAEIYSVENNLTVSILNRFSMKTRCQVVIEKRSEAIDEFPWVIMFAYYLSQQRKKRSAARG